jgi:hypothetical protein
MTLAIISSERLLTPVVLAFAQDVRLLDVYALLTRGVLDAVRFRTEALERAIRREHLSTGAQASRTSIKYSNFGSFDLRFCIISDNEIHVPSMIISRI